MQSSFPFILETNCRTVSLQEALPRRLLQSDWVIGLTGTHRTIRRVLFVVLIVCGVEWAVKEAKRLAELQAKEDILFPAVR